MNATDWAALNAIATCVIAVGIWTFIIAYWYFQRQKSYLYPKTRKH